MSDDLTPPPVPPPLPQPTTPVPQPSTPAPPPPAPAPAAPTPAARGASGGISAATFASWPRSTLVIAAGGLVGLVASFLSFVSLDVQVSGLESFGVPDTTDSTTFSAWNSDVALPYLTLPALLGVAMAALAVMAALGAPKLPPRLLGMEWRQVHLVLGGLAALMMVSFLIGEPFVSDEFMNEAALEELPSGFADNFSVSTSRGAGFWLMLIAAIALVVGAVMRTKEESVV